MRRTSEWIDRTSARHISRYRLWLSLLVFFEVLSCAACSSSYARDGRSQGAAALAAPVAADEVVRVKRVFDGDTVLLEDGRTVRYLGINTPEFQEPFYLKAKQLNESLVLGKEIRLKFDQERADGRDRLLAYVYVGDELVNARLIQDGLAHAFFIGPNRKHNALLLRFQADAQQRGVGIWSDRGRARDLKITNVHPVDPTKDDRYPSYARIANLSQAAIGLAGYVLSNERGQRCVFSDVSVDPGYTLIASSGRGSDGVDSRGQLVVYCSELAWDPSEDTAFLTDPRGNLQDTFHYKGKRVRRSKSRSSN